jgi:hypothetical protein
MPIGEAIPAFEEITDLAAMLIFIDITAAPRYLVSLAFEAPVSLHPTDITEHHGHTGLRHRCVQRIEKMLEHRIEARQIELRPSPLSGGAAMQKTLSP